MLHSMAALMGCYGCSHNTIAGIHILAQIHRLGLRIVMVRKASVRTHHPDIHNAIVAQHPLRHLTTRKTAKGTHLRVFLKLILQVQLHQPTDYSHTNKDYQ